MSVKNEISLQDNERNMEMIELSAFIRNNGKYDDTKISLRKNSNIENSQQSLQMLYYIFFFALQKEKLMNKLI